MSMENTSIVSSEKNEHGEVSVIFSGWGYYTHSIISIGSPDEGDFSMTTMWSWINHLRHKTWWNPILEKEFVAEVNKSF